MKVGRIPKLRWTIIGLFVGAMVINYLARSVLGVAAPVILTEQKISNEQYGWITGAFQIGVMFQPLAGYVLDAIGLRTGFAMFVAVWSLITAAHAFASGWMGFAVLRGALGLAEGSAQPAGQKLIAEWFPAKERGVAGGIYNIGASFGAVFAPPLVAWAVMTQSWRLAFVVAGGIGLVWAVLWFAWFRTPQRHFALGAAERDYILSGQEARLAATAERPRIAAMLRRRDLWGIALPRMLADPVWGMLSFWMPLYLARERGFDLAAIALFAWLPFLAADLGCLFGPAIVAALQRRGIDLIDARRAAFTVGALLMTGMAFVGIVTNPYAAIALLCLGGFAHQTLSVTVITMASDLFRRNEVATAAGLAGFAGNLGVLVFSLLLGKMVDDVGYEPFFVILGVLDLIGALLLWTLVRKPR
ncbi:MFS transporter [Sphingomonas yantingensis]|jgi:ACS family hexuronate transporter-like MFS transporter|uniref:ACS family hexuronate transporter-like MFS transporter n=2 Tax=Sphingomonas TaxID=13687 RepID=A0A7W9EHN5_9SPHN|nr:MFS transporter [Sphingomonas yantingensis]MBB5698323.1 ACS family hexuronate transporter-like MFS transporter [Sphingomonas yantingensis]HCB75851.1 MFS transporter [Sphingomonas bacterium]